MLSNRGFLCDCENFADGSFAALVTSYYTITIYNYCYYFPYLSFLGVAYIFDIICACYPDDPDRIKGAEQLF